MDSTEPKREVQAIRHADFRLLAVALYGLWLLLTVGAIVLVIHEALEDIERDLRSESDKVARELRDHLRDQETALSGFVSFLAATPNPDPKATARFVDALRTGQPHIYMLEIVRRVDRATRPALERHMSARGYPQFAIRSFAYDHGRTWSVVGDKEYTYPIVAMFPHLPQTDGVLGMDVDTVPHLRKALIDAERSEQPVASPVFQLVEGDPAYILFQTIRPHTVTPATDEPVSGHLVALLVVRTASLQHAPLDRRYTVRARMQGHADGAGLLVDHLATDASALERRLLPAERVTVQDIGGAVRATLEVERQARWADISLSTLSVMLLLSMASFGLITTYLVAARQGILRERQYRNTVARLALHDPLTGLANRMLIIDRANQAILAARRQGHMVAVMQINFEGFREVNLRYGHTAGDQLLREAARRLTSVVREADSVGCLGGDEFIAVLTQIAHPNDARAIADKAHTTLSGPYTIGNDPIQLRSCIGISLYPANGGDPETLLRRADQALRDARQSGCDGVIVATDPVVQGHTP